MADTHRNSSNRVDTYQTKYRIYFAFIFHRYFTDMHLSCIPTSHIHAVYVTYGALYNLEMLDLIL